MIAIFRHWAARLAKGQDGQIIAVAVAISLGGFLLLLASTLAAPIRPAVTSAALAILLFFHAMTLFLLGRLRAKVNDVHYAIALEHGIERAEFVVRDFYYEGAAGNPSLQLYSLKILSMCRPACVLELGSGQTTKLLSAYARSNKNSLVVTLEQNEQWATILAPSVKHERHVYLHVPVVRRSWTSQRTGFQLETEWYADLPEEVLGKRYEYILVDGPDDGKTGTEFTPYARAGLLWHLPQLLADRFVILFDDADLYKHQMAISVVKRELSASEIPFISFRVHGIKDQEILCSREWAFLRSV